MSTILGIQDDVETNRRWRSYPHLPFVLVTADKKKLIFHPGVRSLLLKKLLAEEHEPIYLDIHRKLIEDSGEGVNVGRDNLQGAYIVQKDNNDRDPDKICLDDINTSLPANQ